MKPDSYKCWNLQVWRNKSIEFQVSRWRESKRFDFSLWRRRRTDHAGIELCVTVFGIEFRVDFYDHRHWDHELGDYERPSVLNEGFCPIHGCVLIGLEHHCLDCKKDWKPRKKIEYGEVDILK